MKPHKIYSDNIDQSAIDQFNEALSQPYSVKGALMADAHLGYGLPIGGVIATKDYIVPSWVGYDIGCGVCALRLPISRAEIEPVAQQIFNEINKLVPTGFNHNKKPATYGHVRLPLSISGLEIYNSKGGMKQIGTLGGGNHFIEIGYDEADMVWVIIHSGSRGIGHGIATYYMRIAGGGKVREGNWALSVDSRDGINYLRDVEFTQAFALENRKHILDRVICAMDNVLPSNNLMARYTFEEVNLINRNHNHVELKDDLYIHRKGATHAEEGMLGVIPGNMRDGAFIVRGKGCKESLYSSSHGAGRVLGRKQAKKKLSLADFNTQMKDIVSNVSEDTLDEAPDAYKNIFDVMNNQKDLVAILHHIKPILNVKG